MLIFKCDLCGRSYTIKKDTSLYSGSLTLEYRAEFTEAQGRERTKMYSLNRTTDPCAHCEYEIEESKRKTIELIRKTNGTEIPSAITNHPQTVTPPRKKKRGLFGL